VSDRRDTGKAFEGEFARKVDEIVAKYPYPRAAIMPILHLAQERDGYVTLDAEEWIAERLELSPSFVHGVVTFYTMYRTSECGANLLQLCTTVSCMLRGCDRLLLHLKNKLDIDVGETTQDGKFTLVTVECLGSCGTAPMMQINDDYYEDLDLERTDAILDAVARGERPPSGPGPRRVLID